MATPQELQAVLKKFQKTLEAWPKDGGLFLDLMGEKLKKIEQAFSRDIAGQLPTNLLSKTKSDGKNATGEKEIYVALYQMDGENIDKWATTLGSISMQGISRPIYENESDVCSMIRAKEQKTKEGYAVVLVKASDILSPPDLKDRFGKKLVHLKPGALKVDNILRFVHYSGQYLFQKGKLTKLDLASPIREKF